MVPCRKCGERGRPISKNTLEKIDKARAEGSYHEAMRGQTEMELRMFQENEFVYYKMREAALSNKPFQVMEEPSNEIPSNIFHKKP
ncbi:unnamed protein product [Ranitomeya imitator]|uniref:Uncharacterized protein n=1 Tax=Ranitomeya imitator TaxID=111125 RepID=A0ABN9LAE1_9NEOB|nr:unnamed protein product [Ranitomeya imitator]